MAKSKSKRVRPVTEMNGSEKVGSGSPPIGSNKTIAPLDRVRVDSTAREMTTNLGVPIGDNQSSLKAGLRGPTLLEDFILREKIQKSAALSLFARPGDGSIRARRIAIGVADGVHAKELIALATRLTVEGAVPRFLASRLGRVTAADGKEIEVDTSFEATPSVLYDAFVLPDGSDAVNALAADGRVLEFDPPRD